MVTFVPIFITCNKTNTGTIADVAGIMNFFALHLVYFFYLAHINYIRNVAGIESVGLAGDYDGIKEYVFLFYFTFCICDYFRVPKGLEDVSKYPKLIEYLLSQGNWSHDDIIKLIGGNILRVMESNEKV